MRSLERNTPGSDSRVEGKEVRRMSEFKPITSQAELDAIVTARLKRERLKLLRVIIKMVAALQDLASELQG